MSKILKLETLPHVIEKIKSENKSIVLTGGVFDILHKGHIEFLREAKKDGDILIVFVESDENTKSKKTPDRPINTQKHRALILASLKTVDFIILLNGMTKNEEYDKLIVQISPSVIALTAGDVNINKRKNQADMVGAKLLIVERVEDYSTTNLIKNI